MNRTPLVHAISTCSLLACYAAPYAMRAQVDAAAAPPMVVEAVNYQIADYRHTDWGLRYRVHRQDEKEDSDRELIETRDGNVARTLARGGQPLSAEANDAERRRLEGVTSSDMARRRRQAETTEKFGVDAMSVLPKAMIYTRAPTQPQLPQAAHPQVVFDFAPDPAFHPKTTSQAVLPCLEGRVWIDAETHHMLRIEIRVVQNVNLMLGILARVYSGGTLEFEQREVGGGHYGYTHINIDVKLRELMVKVVPYKATLTATDATYMPVAPDFQDAVKMLLARP